MEFLTDPNIYIGFFTLLALEIVLGVDNVVFITILAGKLPVEQQPRARRLGLGLALGMRILLLLTLSVVIGLTSPLFSVLNNEISGRDLILIAGGLFLLGKSTYEIHDKLEAEEGHAETKAAASFTTVIVQIVILDAVFSLDSVITAVGMVEELGVMIAAVVVAVFVMLASAAAISTFVERHPTVKMLALSFLLLIGLALLLDGLDQHIPKGYIYFAMGFSLLVELLNLRVRTKKQRRCTFGSATLRREPTRALVLRKASRVSHLSGHQPIPRLPPLVRHIPSIGWAQCHCQVRRMRSGSIPV